ncbi:Fis family transcriptional regulator [Paraburkholderia nemoris]|uniref:Fis family transcriptional regulator n=1 Tax=Paraburkholderia nemoris TaxID=2793076 RepID=UPI0038BDD788
MLSRGGQEIDNQQGVAAMPVVRKKKKSPSSSSPMQARRSKLLYLPMPRADADQLMLMHRTALEAMRLGHANEASIRRLASVVLLTRYLTEVGHGLIQPSVLDDAESALFDILNTGNETGVWTVPRPALDTLIRIVNEHDRQLRETRQQVIVDASDRLDRLIAQNERLQVAAG